MTRISLLWAHFRKNYETDVALAFGIFATCLGLLDLSRGNNPQAQALVLTVALGILTLIAWGIIKDRERAERLETSLNQLNEGMNRKILVGDLIRTGLEDTLDDAKEEICLLMRTGNILATNAYKIEEAAKRKCSIRVILCSNEAATIRMEALRTHSRMTEQEVLKKYDYVTKTLMKIRDNLSQHPDYGTMQLRTIDYMPGYLLFMSDPKSVDGQALAELVTFQTERTLAANIIASRRGDHELFDYFASDFEKYWKAAKALS